MSHPRRRNDVPSPWTISLPGIALRLAPFGQSGTIRYIYDELGRLVGVIDGAGASATYHYDAVGNLLSITRAIATDVTIIEFTPDGGSIGETVTIYGTGFSATPSSNTVSFNGSAATVTSSTANTIVTTVPSGATTGLLSITSPNGSANSGTNFVVGATAAPSISGFSPAVGTAGASVTVSGSNFETTLAHNRLALNLSRANLVTAAASSLNMTVPAYAGSGRLTLVTPKGTAVSADDFFVPPSPYVASDVVATGRLTFGTPLEVAIDTAEKIGLVVFEGTAAQKISLKIVPPSSGTVALYQPNLGHVDGHSTGIGTTLMEPPLLPVTGTYQFKLDPNFTNTGTYTITLYDVPADVSDTITADGSSKGVTIGTPGQNASLSFSGTATERVSLNVSAGPSGSVALVKPDGSTQEAVVSGTLAKFMEPQELATTGTYVIKGDPTNAATGSLTLNLTTCPRTTLGR